MSNYKIIKYNVIIRKKGYLYFVDKHGNLCEAEPHRNGRKPGTKNKNKSYPH